MNQCMEAVEHVMENCQMSSAETSKILPLLWGMIASLLLLVIPGFAEAAKQCPDGSPAGRGNLCPDIPLNDARWVGYSVPGQMVVGQTYATSATYKNVGDQQWGSGIGHKLGYGGSSVPVSPWGISRVVAWRGFNR